MRRMAAAKTGEEIGALIQELPERSLEEMSEGERECFFDGTEERRVFGA